MIDIVGSCISAHKVALQKELLEQANDPIILKRRFRMIGQLAEYEAQIYKKIYDFSSDDVTDYVIATNDIIYELLNVTNRSG
jgi:uncharacterized protein YjgD (DUF1641 family)